MKKIMKKFIIIIFIVMLLCIQYRVCAMSASKLNPQYTTNKYGFINFGRAVLGYIRNIAAVASVILIAIMGLKFMVGSVEERAEYKKYYQPFIVGILIVLSATTITTWVWDVGKSLNTTCEHDFGGALCGPDSNANCKKCGMAIPKEHSWISIKAGQERCTVCGTTKSVSEG